MLLNTDHKTTASFSPVMAGVKYIMSSSSFSIYPLVSVRIPIMISRETILQVRHVRFLSNDSLRKTYLRSWHIG